MIKNLQNLENFKLACSAKEDFIQNPQVAPYYNF